VRSRSGDSMLKSSDFGSVGSRSGDAMLRPADFGSVRSPSPTGSGGTVGRKSLGRRSMRGSIRRKSIVMKEEEERQAKEMHLAKVASGEHAKALSEKDFSASLEAVDKVYGLSGQPVYHACFYFYFYLIFLIFLFFIYTFFFIYF
jgi:hypothetical protein